MRGKIRRHLDKVGLSKRTVNGSNGGSIATKPSDKPSDPKPAANGFADTGAAGSSTDGNAGTSGAPDSGAAAPEYIYGIDTGDPVISRIDPVTGEPKRGPGRPRKYPLPGGPTSPAGESGLEVLKVSDILFSLHQMAVATLKIPELAIEKDEADRLGKAIVDVAEHYRIALDPRKAAWLNLLGVAGTIYAPRIVAYHIRAKKERAAASRIVEVPSPAAAAAEGPAPAPRANGASRNANTGPYAEVAPSAIWPEPAAEFPGLG